MHDALQARIDSLFFYPVKSCGGVRMPRLRFTETGAIEGDRKWAVVDSNGEAVWQGSHPRLALVRPAIRDNALLLGAPDMPPVKAFATDAGNALLIRIWNDIDKVSETHEGFDAGPEAAAFLRAVTGSDLRLVRLGPGALARDAVNPIHICSASSLHEVNQALAARKGKPVDMLRFRPNIVITGIESPLVPFVEEQSTALRWTESGEEAGISVYGRCIRCVVPNVDLITAEVSDEPANTVAELSAQRYPGGPSFFGVYGKAMRRSSLQEKGVLRIEMGF